MKGWLRRFGHAPYVTLSVIAAAITLGACEHDQSTSTSDGASSDGAGEIATGALASAECPKVTIVSPVSNATFQYVDPGTDVKVTITNPTDCPLGDGPGQCNVEWILNGITAATTTTSSYTFEDNGIGRHHIAARLVHPDDDSPFANCLDSVATIYVKIITICGKAADCDDGNVCSNQSCISNSCNYGPVVGCCQNDFECNKGFKHCLNNKCVDCLENAHCDDGNSCTTDFCDPAGTCLHDPVPNCCHADKDCNDNDYCSIDTCDVQSETCSHVAVDDPLCCNVNLDCQPDDPCVAYLCYHNTDTDTKKCRYGPAEPNCCVSDSQCSDGDVCTIDSCDMSLGGDGDSGLCTHQVKPPDAQTGDICCTITADCDDNDPSTSEVCDTSAFDNTPNKVNVCVYTLDKLYCDPDEAKPVSKMVINEIMAAPGSVPDDLGEWFEVVNATAEPNDEMINLQSWKIEVKTATGTSVHLIDKQFAIGGSTGLQIFPGQHWTAAAQTDKTLNGGFLPAYKWNGISLPDPFETGGATSFTLSLIEPNGTVHDTVTVNSTSFQIQDGRTIALKNPYYDNATTANWKAAGTNKDPAKNVIYGDAQFKLYGTPKNKNTDVAEPVPHAYCASIVQTPTLPGDVCDEGRCSVDFKCVTFGTAGCCTADTDCDDFDLCTSDTCDLDDNICNPSVVNPECCQTHEECDDANPCNFDKCLGAECRYSDNVVPNCCVKNADCDDANNCTVDTCNVLQNQCNPPEPVQLGPGEVCCNTDADCADGNPTTKDICDANQQPKICIHPIDPEYCETVDAPCDDGASCTDDFCDVGAKKCQHAAILGCCKKNSDCPKDNNPCTAEVCEEATGNCSSVAIAGCCIADDQCDDGNGCTTDLCGAGNVCHNNAVAGCCTTSADCNDGASCTQDSCVGSKCEHLQLESCCTPGGSQAQLVADCGQDPDGTANCFVWECTQQGTCSLLQNSICCSQHIDCDDGDPCTTDACTESNTCKHIATVGGACCVFNADCPESDGDTCTSPACSGGTCTETAIPGCASKVPVTLGVTVDMPTDQMTPNENKPGVPASCWKTRFDGALGPDANATCDGSKGTVNNLSTRAFTYNNADSGSVQLMTSWTNGAGNHTLNVYITNTEGVIAGAEQLFSLPMGGTNAGTQLNSEVSNFMLAQKQVWLIFEIVSSAPGAVKVSIDDIVAGAGTAPFFVKALNTGKTYTRAADQLTDGGSVTANLAEVKQKVLWAHDIEWESQTLTFELLGAPSFVTIPTLPSKMNLFGVWQVKVNIAPTKASDVGVYNIKVRVSDGVFVDTIPMTINVQLGAGYVLWTPLGITQADGDAVASALEALGHSYQRVVNLSEVADWKQVKGIFAIVGAAADQASLTNSKITLAVDHLDAGGRVAIFGSWASANQNALYQRCHAALVQADHGVFGALEGTLIHPDKTWGYTNNAAYFNDVDQIGVQPGFASRVTMVHQQDGAGIATIYDDTTNGARHYCSALNFAHVTALGNTPKDLLADVIKYFNEGAPACTKHSHCADGDACTIDQCIGNICKNQIDEFCDKCKDDLDCTSPEACKANGDCIVPPGGIIAKQVGEQTFNCTTSDEFVQIDIPNLAPDFHELLNVNVKLGIELDAAEKMGTLIITLSHNGVVVKLKDKDPTDNSTTWFHTTDFGVLPVEGSMDDFNGLKTNGTWTLTVEDTTGGQACGVIKTFEVWGEYQALPACTTNADCDNGQFCDGAEFCTDGPNGKECKLAPAPTCDDGSPCTKNLCDPLANGGAGACDNSDRVASCAGTPCTGLHAFDPNDGACGYEDACVGSADGTNFGTGVCQQVCDACEFVNLGQVGTTINSFQCVTEVFNIDTTASFVDTANVQAEIEAPDLSKIRVNLFAPSNASVDVTWKGAPGVANSHYTATASFDKIKGEMCSIAGVAPKGAWKLQVCNDNTTQKAKLVSAQLWVSVTQFDPNEGQSCSNAIPIVPNGFTQTFTFDTTCKANDTAGACSGNSGRDIVYTFTVGNTSPSWRVKADAEFPNHDGTIYLNNSPTCAIGSLACADAGGVGATEKIDTQVAPGKYFIMLDSFADAQKGAGTLNLKISEPKANGQVCEEDLDCLSGHCQNGYCCDSGDCCPTNGAGFCPASYTTAPGCDDATTCQGHRVDPTCTNFKCGSLTVADDSACAVTTESDTCGLYDSVFCNGAQVQQDPACPGSCTQDVQCDDGSHCFEGTSQCRLDLANGLDCGRGPHCQTDQCIDGVCCENACGGLCQQCNKAGFLGQCKFRQNGTDPQDECAGTGICGGVCNGAGSCDFADTSVSCDTCTRCDGTGFCDNFVSVNTDPDDTCALCDICDGTNNCVPVSPGLDPLSECADQGASTCDQNGACDGASKCQLYAQGTVCVNQTCTAGYVDPNHTCDGVGGCVDPDDVFCDGHICTGANCLKPCANDGECITGYFCATPGPTGTCQPKKALGDDCAADNQCISNFCTDGVCCEAVCAGPCRQCNLTNVEGDCVDHGAFTDPESGCGLYWCNGTGSCKNTCSSDADCKAGNWCNGSVCEPKKDNGGSCTAKNQCKSDICVLADGVCCDTPCTETCKSCKLQATLGACTLIADGGDPDNECTGTHATCGGTCDGAGSCKYPAAQTDCGTCSWCSGGGQCISVPQNVNPVDGGVEDCGLCQTCNGTGACMNVPLGADFHNDCAASAVSTCGLDGQCDGNAACDFHGSGAVAVAGSCDAPSNTESLPDKCDGSGGTNDGGTKSCVPYVCKGAACGTTCATDADCAATFYCDVTDFDGDGRSDDCEKKKNSGGPCTDDFQCGANAECNNGFCCQAGTDCCSTNSDCQHLAQAAVCDATLPGGCSGHRVDAICDGNKVCQTVTVNDPTACASKLCDGAKCNGPNNLTYNNERICDANGGCSLGGSIVACDDGNTCTNDFCSVADACTHTDADQNVTACYDGPAGTQGKGLCKEGTRTCSGGQQGACTGQVLPSVEKCNDGGADNDCDGVADEEGAEGCKIFFEDLDNDGVGSDNYKCLCVAAGAYKATKNGDCDDGNPGAKPGNTELCSTGYDDNCNSIVNEDGASGCSNFYLDGDSDGVGVGNAVCKCGPADPYDATVNGDCNDGNNTVKPGVTEKCDGIDNNCNGLVDKSEASVTQMCGSPPNGQVDCGAGGCYMANCNIYYFNLDGDYTNGCEAKIDDYDINNQGDFCADTQGGAVQFGDLCDNGGQHNINANIIPNGDVDWYRVRPLDCGTLGQSFHFDIRFTANPSDVHRFDVYKDGCSSLACQATKFYDIRSDFSLTGGLGNQNCSTSNGPQCPSYPSLANDCCGAPGQNCCMTNTVGHAHYFYVRVFRPDNGAFGQNYGLQMSNDVY